MNCLSVLVRTVSYIQQSSIIIITIIVIMVHGEVTVQYLLITNRPLKTKCNITLIKENTTISSPLLCYNTRPQSHFTLSLYVHLFGILLMIMFSFFPIKPLESSSEKIPLAFHIHHAAGRCTNSRPLRGEANPTHGPEAALAPPRSLSIRNIQRFYLSLWKKERAPRG